MRKTPLRVHEPHQHLGSTRRAGAPPGDGPEQGHGRGDVSALQGVVHPGQPRVHLTEGIVQDRETPARRFAGTDDRYLPEDRILPAQSVDDPVSAGTEYPENRLLTLPGITR